jgi:hypothetical protein
VAEPFRAERAQRVASFVVDLPAREAFELFTPEGEKAWAHGWEPEYLHPADGRIVRGMVFRTRAGGEETLWTVARCEPGSAVEYVRCTPGSRIALVNVRCAPLAPGRCEVTVGYAFTGLTQSGNERIREMDERRYADFIGEWRCAIEAMLARSGRAGAQ